MLMRRSVRQRLERLEADVLAVAPRPLFAAHDWTRDIPTDPGVYVLWDSRSGDVVYVGETASLRLRMRDLGRSVNHTCRRKIAAALGLVGVPEAELSAAIGRRYLLSFLAVDFGRCELEEYLMLRWRDSILNAPGQRLHRSGRYDWVEPARPRLSRATLRATARSRRA
jgi:hypothetical protein